MKAWEITNNHLSLNDIEPPAAGPGEVVLDVVYAGLCGSDLAKLATPGRFDLPPTWRPGHEIVARDDEQNLVAVDPLLPCGRCGTCRRGDTQLCPELVRIGWDRPGGYAEKIAVPASNVHCIAGLSPEVATLADPMAVAVHGLRCAGLGRADRIAVIGAGAVGLLTAAYARTLGYDTTLVVRGEPRGQLNGVRMIAREQVAGCRAYDVVVDAASGETSDPLDLALGLAADGGLVIVQNAYQPGVTLSTPLRDVLRRSLQIRGSFSFCRRDGNDFEIALDILRSTPEALTLVDVLPRLDDLRSFLETSALKRPARCVLSVR